MEELTFLRLAVAILLVWITFISIYFHHRLNMQELRLYSILRLIESFFESLKDNKDE